jgi:hypothetical protein
VDNLYYDVEADAEIDRLLMAHGYDRPQMTPTKHAAKLRETAALFSPVRPRNAGLTDYDRDEHARLTTWADPEAVLEEQRRALAARNPLLDPGDIEAAVIGLSGGERDSESQAAAVLELAQMTASELHEAVVALAAPKGESAAERRELAARGHALKDGSYPVPDAAHLRKAAILAASGHGDVKAARALIKKRAGELGVDLDSLPGFSRDDEDLREDARRERHRRRRSTGPGAGGFGPGAEGSGPSGGASEGGAVAASRILASTSSGSYATLELTPGQEAVLGLSGGPGDLDPVSYYLALAQEENGADGWPGAFEPEGPVAPAKYKNVPEVHEITDEDPTDHRSAKEIARLLAAYPDQFGGKENPHGSSASYGPRGR